MATLSIHVSDDVRETLAKRATDQGFTSVESYVEQLVRHDASTRDEDYGAPAHLSPRNREELDALLLQSIEKPGRTIGPEDFEQLRREIIAKYGKQKAG